MTTSTFGHIKDAILKHLYEAGGEAVSGVSISQDLGVSRVAIWKHMNGLKKNGVEIISGPTGYRLADANDLLLPFCFKDPFSRNINFSTELGSTMDEARALARQNAPHLSVVVAENQTKGRGRLNRQWFSQKGGLWFTLIVRAQTSPPMAYLYNFAASLSLCTVIRKLFDLPVSVKWPNDLLLNTNKLAGLLSEMETKGDMVEFVNIGVGLNVNNPAKQDEPRAISIKNALNKSVSRKTILESFLDEFSHRTEKMDAPQIIHQWKQVTSTIGSRVKIETTQSFF